MRIFVHCHNAGWLTNQTGEVRGETEENSWLWKREWRSHTNLVAILIVVNENTDTGKNYSIVWKLQPYIQAIIRLKCSCYENWITEYCEILDVISLSHLHICTREHAQTELTWSNAQLFDADSNTIRYNNMHFIVYENIKLKTPAWCRYDSWRAHVSIATDDTIFYCDNLYL